MTPEPYAGRAAESAARAKANRKRNSLRELYNELIMAVEKKHEGETRHQTALRYIRERESVTPNPQTATSTQPSP